MKKLRLPQSKAERSKLIVILLIMLMLLSFALHELYLFSEEYASLKLPDIEKEIETTKKLLNPEK